MKSFAALLATGIVLAAVGALLWFAGDLERRRAAAEYTLVTLRYERAVQELDAAAGVSLLDPILWRLSPGADDERSIARYW
ncbi:MAG: hypothetical protein ACRD1H_04015, partial [Vicinamibacterales bacterium]